MNAVTLYDWVGSSHIALNYARVDGITPISPQLYYFSQGESPLPKEVDILTVELHKINMQTISHVREDIEKYDPDMLCIVSPRPAYLNVVHQQKFHKVIHYVEDELNYAIAGYKPHKKYDAHTFMVDPSRFGSNITEGNSYIIGYKKDKYMPQIKRIRGSKLPSQPLYAKYRPPISSFLDIPLMMEQFFLTPSEYRHLHTKHVSYTIINNETVIPSLSPEEMDDKGEYYVVQDDAWQVQQIYDINKEGLRKPAPLFYVRVKGYQGYITVIDDMGELYSPLFFNPSVIDVPIDPYRHAYSMDMHSMSYIIKKYVNLLRELNRRI